MNTQQDLGINIQANAKEALVELRNVTKSLKTLEGETRRMSKDTNAMNKAMQGASKSTASFAKAMKGLVAAYLSLQGGKEFIGLLGRIETGFVGVAKTTGLAGKEFEKLKEGIADLSTELSGVGLDELQQIAESAGQLGISGRENILNFTETIAKLAVATDLTAEEAATAFAKLGNVLGEPVEQFERMGSVVNELSNTTTALASEIVDVANRFAGMGKTIGLSSDQIFGLAAALKDVGLTSEVAGSAMTRLLGLMLQKADKFAKFTGKTMDEWSKMMTEKPIDALKLFLGQLSKLNSAGQVKALQDLGLTSVQTATAVLKLAGNTAVLNKDLATSRQEWEKNTSLQNEYLAASKSLEAQFQQTKNTLSVLALRIGEELLPVIKQINEDFRKWVDGLDEEKLAAFGDNIAGLVEVLAKAAKAVGSFVSSFAGFVSEYPNLALGLAGLVIGLKTLRGILGLVGVSMLARGRDMATMSSAAGTLTGSIGTLGSAVRTVARLLGRAGPLGLAISGAVGAVGALALAYEQSAQRTIAANMQSAQSMAGHIDALKSIGQAYAQADAEMQKHGEITHQTRDRVKAALEAEIASIEEQLAVWEKSTDTTEEQDKAAESLAKTLGALQAKLDTLDAQYTLKIEADSAPAEQKIDQVEQKAAAAKPTVAVSADTAKALAAIEKLKKPTSSTHTVYVRTVQLKAAGGYIDSPGALQRLAGGGTFTGAGRVPGYDPTDSDRVNARLTGGEYVIPRRAVDRYGVGIFEAFRQMKLPRDLFAGIRLPSMPKLPALPAVRGYAAGGSVTAPASSGRPVNLHIGGETFGLNADDAVADALVRYIERKGGL